MAGSRRRGKRSWVAGAAAIVAMGTFAALLVCGCSGGQGAGENSPAGAPAAEAGSSIYVLTKATDTRTSTPDVVEYVYDDAGNLVGLLSENWNKGFELDANGFTTALLRCRPGDTDFANPYTVDDYDNEFDGAGRLVKCTEQGVECAFEYYDDGTLKRYETVYDVLEFDEGGHVVRHEIDHEKRIDEIDWTFGADGAPASFTVAMRYTDEEYAQGVITSEYTVETDSAGNIIRVYGDNGYGKSILMRELEYREIAAPSAAARTFAPYIAMCDNQLAGIYGIDYGYLK